MIVLERRFGRVQCGDRLRNLRAVIIVRQNDQLLSLPNVLAITHLHFANQSDHLGAQWGDFSPDVRIVGYLLAASPLPRKSSCA